MFSGKKIAAVSVLLGGLAVTCAGVSPAYAAGTSGSCAPDITGSVRCQQNNTGYTSEGGKYDVRQAQDCIAVKPLAWPAQGLLNTGSTQIGPAVTCSNSAPTSAEQMPNLGS